MGIGMKTLKVIPFPGFTNATHIKGYPEGTKAHPARNHPKAVAWLIERYTEPGDLVWDPMVGAGTMAFEAIRLGRKAAGWDLIQACREQALRIQGFRLLERPADGSVRAIITSPSFFGTNHEPGDTDAQKAYTKRMRSVAGNHYAKEKIPGHLGQLKAHQESIYWWLLGNLYARCVKALAVGGKMVIIVRDRVMKAAVFDFVRRNKVLLEFMGLKCLGSHPRLMPPSARWQQREKLKPGQIHIGREEAVVFERVVSDDRLHPEVRRA